MVETGQELSVIATSVFKFKPDNPDTGEGTFRPPHYENIEHCYPLAVYIVKKLSEAGFEITPKAKKIP